METSNKICDVCKKEIEGESFSAEPLLKDKTKICCRRCKIMFVSPASLSEDLRQTILSNLKTI